jgi:hypothetical protein
LKIDSGNRELNFWNLYTQIREVFHRQPHA